MSSYSRQEQGLPVRVLRAARALNANERLAALATLGLLFSLFLPWYQKNYDAPRGPVSQKLSALGALTWVEGAVLLVAIGVLILLFLRAERGNISLPGRDGTVLLGAGVWTLALVVFRIFSQPAASGPGATVGIAWGIFFALVAAGALTTAGMRQRAASAPLAPARRRRERIVGAGGLEPARGPATSATEHLAVEDAAMPERPTAATERFREPARPKRPPPRPAPSARDRRERDEPPEASGRLF
jgi:hypothetical protein